jgi:hypothetical protein
MIDQSNEEAVLRRYLLGDLDESLHEEVEERLLCDNTFADRLSDAQDYLIDDYVFNALSDSEHESFQKNFVINNERLEKIRVAEALQAYVIRREKQRKLVNSSRPWPFWKGTLSFVQTHWLSLALSVGAVIIVLGVPKVVPWFRPLNNLAWEARRQHIERQIAELNKNRSVTGNGAMIELRLQDTVLREGSETKRVLVSNEIKILNLILEFRTQDYQSYQALVMAVDRGEFFAVNDLKAENGAGRILFSIPTEFLPSGDYQVDLKGIKNGTSTDIARYNFRLVNAAK